MKKKAIKIAASTAVAASAFVAAAPAQQADAATNVNQLITDAQNAGTVLKWAISVEGTADYKTEPWAEYNNAKNALKKAEAAIAKLDASAKLAAQAKLVDPKVSISRAGAYIDAITSGKKILDKNAKFDAAVKTNDLNAIEKEYHVVTEEFRKQTVLNYRVYGQSTRDEILKEYKLPIEKSVRGYANEVTVHMLAREAGELVKANKLVDAAAKIAEAQAILDANNLKWEATLQKSVTDVATSLPLTVLSAVRVDANTIKVTLNKTVDAVSASQFTINDLGITSVSLGSDKKTVTLTTTTQAAAKTYTVTFNGSSASFTTPAAGGSLVDVDGTTIHSQNGVNVTVKANIKEETGEYYQGAVNVLVPASMNVVSIENGRLLQQTETINSVVYNVYRTTPVANGAVSLVVSSTNAAGGNSVSGKVIFRKVFNNNEVDAGTSGTINFYSVASDNTLLASEKEVTYVDAANKYFVVNAGTAAAPNHVKYTVDSYDALANETTTGLSLDQFFTALNKGDKVISNVYSTVSGSSSHFKITFNKVLADFSFASKYNVKNNEKTTGYFRTDNSRFSLEGTGQPGNVVHVYTNDGTKLGTTTISSNGTWSYNTNIDSDAITTFYADSQEYGKASTFVNTLPKLNVLEGDFDVETVAISNPGASDSFLGRTITLTDSAVTPNDSFEIKSGATINLTDDDGTVISYTDGVNANFEKVSNTVVTITVTGSYKTVSAGTVAGLDREFGIQSVTGIQNSYGLVAKPAKTILSR